MSGKRKLDPYQLLLREGYLWMGSILGIVVYGLGSLMSVAILGDVAMDAMKSARAMPIWILCLFAFSVSGRVIGWLVWRHSDEGKKALGYIR